MYLGDNIIAGIGPGGLKDIHEVKIFICHIMNTLRGSVSREELSALCTSDGATDYFTFCSAFEELVELGSIVETDRGWVLSRLGKKTAETLAGELPASLREKTASQSSSRLARLRREGEVRTEIVPHQSGYHVRCSMKDGNLEFMNLSFYAPDLNHAVMIRDRLQNSSTDIYTVLMKLLTTPDETDNS